MSWTIKERSKGMSMPFMFFQLVQLMFCSRDFIGERIDKTPRKGEMLFSKTIIPTWRKQWHPTPVLLLGNLMDGGAC